MAELAGEKQASISAFVAIGSSGRCATEGRIRYIHLCHVLRYKIVSDTCRICIDLHML